MNAQWPKEMTDSARLLINLLKSAPPERAQAMLGGFLGTVMGNLPDSHWQAMLAESALPCDLPDCGCEKFRKPVFDALDLVRTDFLEQTSNE